MTNKVSRSADFKHAINAVMVTLLEMLRRTARESCFSVLKCKTVHSTSQGLSIMGTVVPYSSLAGLPRIHPDDKNITTGAY